MRPHELTELFTRYLRRQTEAQAEGLGFPEPGEVEPYEAVPVQPVDPKLAWDDALAAGRLLKSGATWAVPPDWPSLVTGQEPAVALAFSLGNFPQLVRNLHPLLAGGDLMALRGLPARPAAPPGLAAWANRAKNPAEVLLAVGVLRLARHFDEAEALLRRGGVPAEWQGLRQNEEAALAWHRGQAEEASALWRRQADSVPVLFNRGMSALFLGRAAEARESLTRAAAGLPETNAWHHLAQLYLALATLRG
jgi:hypothetical protein